MSELALPQAQSTSAAALARHLDLGSLFLNRNNSRTEQGSARLPQTRPGYTGSWSCLHPSHPPPKSHWLGWLEIRHSSPRPYPAAYTDRSSISSPAGTIAHSLTLLQSAPIPP